MTSRRQYEGCPVQSRFLATACTAELGIDSIVDSGITVN